MTFRFLVRQDFLIKMRMITHDLTSSSRAENGCILYHFAESTDKEGIFFFIMIWRDEASYQRYATSDYVRAFTSILAAGMLERPPVMEKWRLLG